MTLVKSLFVFDDAALCNGEHEFARAPTSPVMFPVCIATDLGINLRPSNPEKSGNFTVRRRERARLNLLVSYRIVSYQ